MILTFVVERELRVAARKQSTYRFRVGSVGGLIAVGCFLMLVSSLGPSSGTSGRTFFVGLSTLLLAVCLFEGARSTSESISEERRQGTLGLLFLTDLRELDVVLGKFAAMALRPMYAMLAVLPILSLGVPMGGVSGAEFWRMAAALMVNLLFSLSLGLAVSTLTPSGRRTFHWALGGLAMLAGLPLLVGAAVSAAGWANAGRIVIALSPLFGFEQCDDISYRASAGRFWLSIVAGLFWTMSSIAVASRAIGRAWRETGPAVPGARRLWLDSIRPRKRETAKAARAAGTWKPIGDDENPALRLFVRPGANRRLAWGAVVVGILFAVVVVCGLAWEWPIHATGVVGITVAFILGIGVRIGLASQVAHDIAAIRQGEFLELLLTTPLTQQRILAGLFGATERLWALAVGLQLLISVVSWLLTTQFEILPSSIVFLALSGPVQSGLFAMDLLTLYYTAAWFAITSGKPNSAAVRAIVFTQVLPSLVCCWGILRLLTDVVFLVVAAARLKMDWRTMIERQKQGARSL